MSQEQTPLHACTVWYVLEGKMQKGKERANKEAVSALVHLVQQLYVLSSHQKLYQKYGVHLFSKCIFFALCFLKVCELCISDSETP